MTDTKQPEALRLASYLESGHVPYHPESSGLQAAADALRHQHARIAKLEAQLAAGAGGVTGLRADHLSDDAQKVRFERAKGTTTDEMRDNLSETLYGCGDAILVWANEGDLCMFGAAIAQEGGK